MNYRAKTIRTFIGSQDFKESSKFYRQLGFEEVIIGDKLSLFKVNENLGFYLQDYYVKKWVQNSMVFLEIDDIETCWLDLKERGLQNQYKFVRLSQIKEFEWGRECFLHDPSGVLWHFCEFKK